MNGTRTLRRGLALATLGLAFAAAAEAKVRLSDSGGERVHDCGNDPAVEIKGSGFEVRLTGACTHVDISGTNVVVHAQGVGHVEISGLNNTLEWQYATGGRSRPNVEQNGLGHRVVKVEAQDEAKPEKSAAKPAAPAAEVAAKSGGSTAKVGATGVTASASAAPARVAATVALEAETSTAGIESGSGGIRITGHGIRRRIDCGGAKVQILGDDVVALLLGDCPNVQIAGDRGEVWIERVDQLQILGAASRAFYVGSTDGDRVKVSLVGAGSTARAVGADELAERRKR